MTSSKIFSGHYNALVWRPIQNSFLLYDDDLPVKKVSKEKAADDINLYGTVLFYKL